MAVVVDTAHVPPEERFGLRRYLRGLAAGLSEGTRARIGEHIDANLGDPGLGPGTIASVHFISRRHLQRLFRDEGATVSESIRARRPERAPRDLSDLALAGEPIVDIAASWGCVTKSHSTRAFRAAHSRTPGDFRRRASLPVT